MLFLILSTLFVTSCFGNGSVTLAWDPNNEPDLTGYVVYFGTASGMYTNRVDVGNVTTNTVTGLVEGTDYFFAVTAYNSSRLESDYSNEISFRLPSTSQPTPFDIPDSITSEDVAAGPIAFTVGDVETPAGSLVLSAVSSNPKLVPDAGIIFGGSGSNRTVLIQPATNQFGAATITVIVRDAGGRTAMDTFLVTVEPVNDPPTISRVADQTMNEDDSLSVAVALNDAETTPGNLILSATSSNTGLVPNGDILLGGSGPNRSMMITPPTTQNGTAIITLTVADGDGGSVSESFALSVNAVNDPPTLATPGNSTINEDAGPQTVGLSGIGSGASNENQALAVSAVSSNPALIPAPTVSYTSPNSTGSLIFKPVANANGIAVITVTVNDGQSQNNTISRTFTATVNPVNDPPSISNIADQTTNEDTPISIPFTVGDPETALPSLTVTAASTNAVLIPATNIVINGSGADRTLTITPAPNTFGKSLITVVVSDGVSVTGDSFLVTVNAVNDPPTLDPLVDLSFAASSGEQAVSLTGISSGTANESQALIVSVTSSDTSIVPAPMLSYANPAATGTISFSPASNEGKAIITVTVSDGGTS